MDCTRHIPTGDLGGCTTGSLLGLCVSAVSSGLPASHCHRYASFCRRPAAAHFWSLDACLSGRGWFLTLPFYSRSTWNFPGYSCSALPAPAAWTHRLQISHREFFTACLLRVQTLLPATLEGHTCVTSHLHLPLGLPGGGDATVWVLLTGPRVPGAWMNTGVLLHLPLLPGGYSLGLLGPHTGLLSPPLTTTPLPHCLFCLSLILSWTLPRLFSFATATTLLCHLSPLMEGSLPGSWVIWVEPYAWATVGEREFSLYYLHLLTPPTTEGERNPPS